MRLNADIGFTESVGRATLILKNHGMGFTEMHGEATIMS